MRRFYEIDGWTFENVREFYTILAKEANKTEGENSFRLPKDVEQADLVLLSFNQNLTSSRESTGSIELKYNNKTIGLVDIVYENKFKTRENPIYERFKSARLRPLDCDVNVFEQVVKGVLEEKVRRVSDMLP